MANLTISVDDALIKRARIRAIEQGSSLSAKVREFLLRFVEESADDLARQRAQATARLLAAMAAASTEMAPAATRAAPMGARRTTLREELYAGDFRAEAREAALAAAAAPSRARRKSSPARSGRPPAPPRSTDSSGSTGSTR